MSAERYIKLGQFAALISFAIGMAILALSYQVDVSLGAFIGFFYALVAGLINLIILIAILIKMVKEQEKRKRKRLLCTSGLMALNIPICLVCIVIISVLFDTMRITFINATDTVLTDINVVAYEKVTEHFDQLEKGEKKTVWISIFGDGNITINYLINGERKEEYVEGYVTTCMGKKKKYNIGSEPVH
jgi:hypothetical protein